MRPLHAAHIPGVVYQPGAVGLRFMTDPKGRRVVYRTAVNRVRSSIWDVVDLFGPAFPRLRWFVRGDLEDV